VVSGFDTSNRGVLSNPPVPVWIRPRWLTQGTAHVHAAAHGGLYLAVTVGTFRDLYLPAIVQIQHTVDQGSVALGAGGVDCHAAFLAFIRCHLKSFHMPLH
jgi:hypothetical protein